MSVNRVTAIEGAASWRVRTSVGVGRRPVSLVSHALADGKLVRLGDVDAPEMTLWTLYPTRRLFSELASFVQP